MKLAIMQPYFFPYIGYFQLMHAVDKWVVYDDVAFIKQGWVNRNRMLLNGQAHMFSVPLQNASSFVPINQTLINSSMYKIWGGKFLKTIEQSYGKSPYMNDVFPFLMQVIETEHETIASLALHSLKAVVNYLGLQTRFVDSSSIYNNKELSGQERVIDICKKEQATSYINVPGGRSLYDMPSFSREGIKLHFIEPVTVEYKQLKNTFVPWLSIIDVLFFNSNDQVLQLLTSCQIQEAQ